jgi:uncharacterized membrane protein
MPSNHISFLQKLFGEGEESRKKVFRSIRAKFAMKRTPMEKLADAITDFFGSSGFLWFNILFFITWILLNAGLIPSVPAFDPYPYILLTTIVSIEAIILAIFVLISQNRTAKIDDLREETHLQLNIIAEKEITKIMKMLAILLEKQGVDLSQDPELHQMIRPISEEEIEKRLEREIL